MTDQNVTCPNCGNEFELGAALTDKLSQALRNEMETQVRKKEKELRDKLKMVDGQKADLEREIENRVNSQKSKLATDAKLKAREEIGIELEAARQELDEKTQKLASANKMELELRKRERELTEAKEAQELELLKKLDEERGKIAQVANEKAAQQQQLKLREKENLIESLKDQVGNLQRRIEVGSQESQGEALEEELLGILRGKFPFDEFEEIKKGQRGADILQRVRNQSGTECGTIVWESKNTKAFSKSWIDKLKEDQQRVNADLAVLVTIAMPPEIKNFDLHQDIWISDFASALNLCGVLREMLIGVNRAKLVSSKQEGMKDLIYKYVTGQEFGQRVKMIASAYDQMQTDLAKEKRAMEKIWKKREKQILTVLDNLSGMHGELEGLLIEGAASLPSIDVLSLEGIADQED